MSNETHAGIEIIMPPMKEWDVSDDYDYTAFVDDYTSLQELGASIAQARMALFTWTEKINNAERMERDARTQYERAFRRAYLLSTEKTETAKKERAALVCEDLENEWIMYDQLKKEFERASAAIRTELQTLQSIGNNLRQQMRF